jgi:hypothetical protein
MTGAEDDLSGQAVAASAEPVQPVDLFASGPAGVGKDVDILPVGLGLTRLQVRGAADHQARRVGGYRRAPTSGHRQREPDDRARLIRHQPRHPPARVWPPAPLPPPALPGHMRWKTVHGALAGIHLTNQRSSGMFRPEVHPPAMPASNTPAGPKSCMGNEPCRHRRTSQAWTVLAPAHPRR